VNRLLVTQPEKQVLGLLGDPTGDRVVRTFAGRSSPALCRILQTVEAPHVLDQAGGRTTAAPIVSDCCAFINTWWEDVRRIGIGMNPSAGFQRQSALTRLPHRLSDCVIRRNY
jgi:hypothetical protein